MKSCEQQGYREMCDEAKGVVRMLGSVRHGLVQESRVKLISLNEIFYESTKIMNGIYRPWAQLSLYWLKVVLPFAFITLEEKGTSGFWQGLDVGCWVDKDGGVVMMVAMGTRQHSNAG